ncbi:MAG: ADP-ribosylation factor-like protein [Promethearchaeota archaeon]
MKKPYDYKIYVCGFFQAGKTTLVHSLDSDAMSIDKPLKDLYRGEQSTTTVGFDLGHLVWARPNKNKHSDGVIMSKKEYVAEKEEYKGWDVKLIEIKGSPGQLHFKVIREIVAKGSDGVLFLVDSSDPGSIGNAMTLLSECRCLLGDNVPLVVIANKQDLDSALSPEEVSNLINEKAYAGSGKNNFGIKEAIIKLLKMIENNGKLGEEITGGIRNYVIS